ncbi:dihydrodipicolinate synthase family protein [Microlunatus sp. Y2014]|uniref:dihydrodipicolinate synthase family protein n=1 Tax=Microlunatus sp. Y2014 TaxID=3418488 RepID=UPI003DA77C75
MPSDASTPTPGGDSTTGATGLIPILATPFDQGGDLDVDSLRRLVEFELACGVDGLAVHGMASEGFSLTAAERSTIVRTVREVAGGDVPLVAGVNATSTSTAVEQGVAAVEDGADQLMVLPPFLSKLPPAHFADFYGSVADRTGVPIMIQEASASTGVAMSTAQLVDLGRLPGVVSVKIETQPTAPKVAALCAATTDLAVLGGQNALFVLEEYEGGAVGTMPACEFSDALAVILRDWNAGRHDDAHAGFNRLLPLIRFGLQPGIAHAVHKEVLVRRRVIDHAGVRSPVSPLDAHSHRTLERVLATSGLLDVAPVG